MSDKRQVHSPMARMKRLAGPLAFAILAVAIYLLPSGSTLRAGPELVPLGNPTYVSGVIDTDTIWTLANSPYIVTGDLTVSEGVTLTIEPGVEVRFATTDDQSSGEDPDRVELIVAGALVTDGVTFTSNADSSAAGDWYGIRFLDSSADWDGSGGSIITNSTIKYGTVGISIGGASPMILNNTIVNMKGDDGPDLGLSEECGDLGGEDGYGIYITNGSSPTIDGNTISRIFGGVGGNCAYWVYMQYLGKGGGAVGIFVSNNSSPSITDNDIFDVNGARCGGLGVGIYVSASSATITENEIALVNGNSVVLGGGSPRESGPPDGGLAAGIYITDASSVTVDSNIISSISGGTGANGWAELYCRGGSKTGDGGMAAGIYAVNSSFLNIINNVFSETMGGDGGKGKPECAYDPPDPGGNGGIGAGVYAVSDEFLNVTNNTICAVQGGYGGEGAPATNIEEGVWTSTDDAREFANGDYDDGGPAVLLGDYCGIQDYVGFRFTYVPIPKWAVIDSAVLTLMAYESSLVSSADGTKFLIKGEAIGNSPPFSVDNSPRDRSPTAVGVTWTVTEDWAQGQTYSSPDLSEVIQEIVNREDWDYESALTILVLDTAVDDQSRRACTWDKDPLESARLNITLHTPSGRDGIGIGVNVDISSTVSITNNIILSHTIGISSTTTTATISHNDVWGNSEANYSGVAPGAYDISADPLFVDPANNDYHLQCGSPAIDAGTNEGAPPSDFEGDPRPLDGNSDGIAMVDIGADEFVRPVPPLFGDFNCDCVVDVADIMMVAIRWRTRWGDPNYVPLCDIDGDGDIDIVDIMLVAVHWGERCE